MEREKFLKHLLIEQIRLIIIEGSSGCTLKTIIYKSGYCLCNKYKEV